MIWTAIRDLTARRLVRALLPLPPLLLAGVIRALRQPGGDGLLLAAGALITAAAMVFHGMGMVGRVVGARRAWMRWSGVAGAVPWLYGLWVVTFPGLRAWARPGEGRGLVGGLAAVVFVVLGGWVLWGQARLGEVGRLAAAMVAPTPEEGTEGPDPAGPGGIPEP